MRGVYLFVGSRMVICLIAWLLKGGKLFYLKGDGTSGASGKEPTDAVQHVCDLVISTGTLL